MPFYVEIASKSGGRRTAFHQFPKRDTPYAEDMGRDGADGCDEGVFASALAYDKAAGRFLIAAICGDVALPKVLLAVSATTSVTVRRISAALGLRSARLPIGVETT